jgi:ubiquinone/menaquinone biosynthesis C-methylase UbiE
MSDAPTGDITFWIKGVNCCDAEWEAAYSRFESTEEEKLKFRRRLVAMGVSGLSRDLRVADLFCGRGSNLAVLEEMGFADVSGVDLSPDLLSRYRGRAKLYVGDCRDLRFADASMDLVMVQGGLHHLPRLPEDLDRCLGEIARILAPGGIVLFVEPCLTPYLRLAHACCGVPLLRRLSPRLDALAVMIAHERQTYESWLSAMGDTRRTTRAKFETVLDRASMGKWYFAGRKAPAGSQPKP